MTHFLCARGSLRHASSNWEKQEQFPAHPDLAEVPPGLVFKTRDPRWQSGSTADTFIKGSQALPPLMGVLYFSSLVLHRMKHWRGNGELLSPLPCPEVSAHAALPVNSALSFSSPLLEIGKTEPDWNSSGEVGCPVGVCCCSSSVPAACGFPSEQQDSSRQFCHFLH